MSEIEEFTEFSKRISQFRVMGNKRIQEILDESASSLKKVEILSCIISHGGLELEDDDFSDGSTVTRTGLERACIANGVTIPKPITKKTLLIALLNHVNRPYIEGDLHKKGSTVERVALLRIYRGLLDKN
jgi:hypothetical protein